MLMRYHFGLAVGHAYSHCEFTPHISTIIEHDEEPNAPSGSQIPETSVPSPEQELATHSPTHVYDGGAEDTLSDVDSESEDEKSLDLASDEGSEGDLDECRLDWDEELIAEEMYED